MQKSETKQGSLTRVQVFVPTGSSPAISPFARSSALVGVGVRRELGCVGCLGLRWVLAQDYFGYWCGFGWSVLSDEKRELLSEFYYARTPTHLVLDCLMLRRTLTLITLICWKSWLTSWKRLRFTSLLVDKYEEFQRLQKLKSNAFDGSHSLSGVRNSFNN